MGRRNYLVEGSSGAGKTAVCQELLRRGYSAINGDTELAYQGDPATGLPTDVARHEHHLWDVQRVRELTESGEDEVTFFCGGSRNFGAFLHLFDAVFVLEVDAETLRNRLSRRSEDEWGGLPEQRDFVLQLHADGGDVPPGTRLDATRPLPDVVDELLRLTVATGEDSTPRTAR